MDKEVGLLLSLIDSPESIVAEGLTLHKGRLGRHEVTVAKCGIGKVNAALNAFKVIRATDPDLVINSGVAGGAGLPVGTLLVADSVAYDDVWCGPGTEFGQADGFPLFMTPSVKVDKALVESGDVSYSRGLICTGDRFISTPEEIAFIRTHYPGVRAVDMESAAIAQTCLACGKEFAIVRVVSDTPGEGENIAQYRDFWTHAPEKTFQAVRTVIQSL